MRYKKWGEIIAACIIINETLSSVLNLEAIQKWASGFLSNYKIPRKLVIVHELPKNSLGKVIKSKVKDLFH